MVSFVCHACGEVIKKPKLDQHHGRCHTGFDCLDCSVTFKTPAEYKSHTSCVSEAEKYQKSLYKGPRRAKEGGNYISNDANENGNDYGYGARGGRGGFRGRGQGNGRGGFQGRGGYQGGGRPRDEGTGANGTPLGSPQRMSPVTAPLDCTHSDSKVKNETICTSSSVPTLGLEAAPASSPTKNEQSGPSPSSEKLKKEKKHKEKKSKSKSKPESQEPKEEVKANELVVVEQSTAPRPSLPEKASDVTEKKRKRKNAKGEQTTTAKPPKVVTEEQAKGDGTKEKKKNVKGEFAPGDANADVTTQTKGESSEQDKKKRRKKDKNEKPVRDESKMEVEEKSIGADGKRKKKSKDKISDPDALKVDPEPPSDAKDVKKKKRKSEKIPDEPAAPTVEPVTEPLQSKASEINPKKRERKGEQEDGDAAVAKGKTKRTKKNSKDLDGTETTPAIAEVKESATSATPMSGKKRKRDEKGTEVENGAPKAEDRKEKRKRAKE